MKHDDALLAFVDAVVTVRARRHDALCPAHRAGLAALAAWGAAGMMATVLTAETRSALLTPGEQIVLRALAGDGGWLTSGQMRDALACGTRWWTLAAGELGSARPQAVRLALAAEGFIAATLAGRLCLWCDADHGPAMCAEEAAS